MMGIQHLIIMKVLATILILLIINNIVDETISDANSNSELEVVLINQRKYHLQPFLPHLQIRMI